MKIFALLTASLMAAGGATYFYASSEGGCPLGRCPVATSGGCCSADKTAAKSSCCEVPCPACDADCAECCSVCETCCLAGAGSVKSLPTAAKAKPANCCLAGDACCEISAPCCGDKADSPVSVATAAALAGAGTK